MNLTWACDATNRIRRRCAPPRRRDPRRQGVPGAPAARQEHGAAGGLRASVTREAPLADPPPRRCRRPGAAPRSLTTALSTIHAAAVDRGRSARCSRAARLACLSRVPMVKWRRPARPWRCRRHAPRARSSKVPPAGVGGGGSVEARRDLLRRNHLASLGLRPSGPPPGARCRRPAAKAQQQIPAPHQRVADARIWRTSCSPASGRCDSCSLLWTFCRRCPVLESSGIVRDALRLLIVLRPAARGRRAGWNPLVGAPSSRSLFSATES